MESNFIHFLSFAADEFFYNFIKYIYISNIQCFNIIIPLFPL